MYWIIVGVFIPLIETDAIDIKSTAGSDVLFHLPSFQTCPNLRLSDPKDVLLLTVTNSSPRISDHVIDRSELTLANGSVIYTLKSVEHSDEGSYFLEVSDGVGLDECGRVFSLELERNFNDRAYWLSWGPWSACDDVTRCRRGLRARTRECTIPGHCYHGDRQQCENQVTECFFYAWGSWSAWSQCSATCGTGYKRRQRTCWDSTAEGSTLNQCVGEETGDEECIVPSCSIPVEWGAWSEWSGCSATCGNGYKRRHRKCNNMDNTVDQCEGEKDDMQNCQLLACRTQVLEWGAWSEWSGCSVTCGNGYKRRHRKCNTVDSTVDQCEGETDDMQECQLLACRTNLVPFSWSAWSSWSTCSKSCDTGWQVRDRKCFDQYDREVPGYCRGQNAQNDTCTIVACNDPDETAPAGAVSSGSSLFTALQVDASSGGEATVSVPVSTIVGAVAGVFILLLLIVIVTLVMLLRWKSKKVTNIRRGSRKKEMLPGRQSLQLPTKSGTEMRMSKLSDYHVYAEINDDDVYVKTEKRMSVVTFDNTYAPLPKSASVPEQDQESSFSFSHTSGYQETPLTYVNTDDDKPVETKNKKRLDSVGYLAPVQLQGQGQRKKRVYHKKRQ